MKTNPNYRVELPHETPKDKVNEIADKIKAYPPGTNPKYYGLTESDYNRVFGDRRSNK